jgi:hypothetical protein
VSDIPNLDLEAAQLAQLIDAVLINEHSIAANEETRETIFSSSSGKHPANSIEEAQHRFIDQVHERNSTDAADVQALRKHLANVTAQHEHLSKVLEAANRKAAIGRLSAELKGLTKDIEHRLVRYAALMHLIEGAPLDTLSIAQLYNRESEQRAQKIIDKIKQKWREI